MYLVSIIIITFWSIMYESLRNKDASTATIIISSWSINSVCVLLNDQGKESKCVLAPRELLEKDG